MKDVYSEVTAKIITLMETHGANWTKPWSAGAGSSSMPTSISTGTIAVAEEAVLELLRVGLLPEPWRRNIWNNKALRFALGLIRYGKSKHPFVLLHPQPKKLRATPFAAGILIQQSK